MSFSVLLGNDFYIAGESYGNHILFNTSYKIFISTINLNLSNYLYILAGHYVPQLAMKIVAGNKEALLAAKQPNQPHIQQINLKGVLSGNPSTSQYDGQFYFPFMMQHALIGLQVHTSIEIDHVYFSLSIHLPRYLFIEISSGGSSTVIGNEILDTYNILIWGLLNKTQQ